MTTVELTLAQVRAILVRMQQNAQYAAARQPIGSLRRAHAEGAAVAYENALTALRAVHR